MEEKPPDSAKVGNRKAPELGHSSRRFVEPCDHRWLFVGSVRKVARVWMVSGQDMGPVRGMYGTLEAELEVQRTISRAELTAFLCLLRKGYRSYGGSRR